MYIPPNFGAKCEFQNNEIGLLRSGRLHWPGWFGVPCYFHLNDTVWYYMSCIWPVSCLWRCPVENDSTTARNIGNRLSLRLWLVAWLIHERRQTPLKKLTADKIFFNRLFFYCKATRLYFIALWRLKSSRNVMFRLKATQYGYWLCKHCQCDPIWRRSLVAKVKAKANHQPGTGWSSMCRVSTAP